MRQQPVKRQEPAVNQRHYAIGAGEVTQGVENPIVWRLLTALTVGSLKEALLCIQWYTYRWIIEEKGFNIEARELSQGKSIGKLCLLMLETIIKLFVIQIA